MLYSFALLFYKTKLHILFLVKKFLIITNRFEKILQIVLRLLKERQLITSDKLPLFLSG